MIQSILATKRDTTTALIRRLTAQNQQNQTLKLDEEAKNTSADGVVDGMNMDQDAKDEHPIKTEPLHDEEYSGNYIKMENTDSKHEDIALLEVGKHDDKGQRSVSKTEQGISQAKSVEMDDCIHVMVG